MSALVSICMAESNTRTCDNIETTRLTLSSSSLPLTVPFIFHSLGATALDSLSAGYRTVLIDDCCRGVDLTDIETTKEGILSNHGIIVQSKEVGWWWCRCCFPTDFAIITTSSGKTFVAPSHLILMDGTWFKFNCLRFLSLVSEKKIKNR